MTNDIASELALLHTLKGAAYVSQLKAIAARMLSMVIKYTSFLILMASELQISFLSEETFINYLI